MRPAAYNIVFLLLCTVSLITAPPSLAQIYKYKDEKGRWQFTDKKPANNTSTVVSPVKNTAPQRFNQQDRSNWTNLAEKLHKQYQPKSPIEDATLAVVSIETSMGVGSGFFVSDAGHIITNKHVIRPKKSSGWQEEKEQLEQVEEDLRELFKALKNDKEDIQRMKQQLEDYRHQLLYPSRYYNPIDQAQYDNYERRYKSAKKRRREFKQQQSQFKRLSSQASLSKHFKIYFKDNTTATAHLVKLAPKQDIAILKLDGYITPYLQRDHKLPSQAMQVYAIGSPLGHRDLVTSGIVTRVEPDEIITDATILPGNSGGPLISPEGTLYGVNTQKIVAGKAESSEGFGIAIPITKVFEEFGTIISPPASNADKP